eukprot:SAG11_NODE_18125_length_499_cov_0.902500_1_plen_55_part_01
MATGYQQRHQELMCAHSAARTAKDRLQHCTLELIHCETLRKRDQPHNQRVVPLQL